jgi:hypothetical protein
VDATSVIEREVRELVRRRGLDPASDQSRVRRLVDEVFADYDECTLTSSLPPFVKLAQRRCLRVRTSVTLSSYRSRPNSRALASSGSRIRGNA